MDPVSAKENKIEWRIEYTNGNLTSSFNVTNTLEKPLSVMGEVEIPVKLKGR